MKINEPIALLRDVSVRLVDYAENGVAGLLNADALIKIGKPGANLLADAVCTLTEVTGGADAGSYRMRISPGGCSAAGEVEFEISDSQGLPGRFQPFHGFFDVEPIGALYYGRVVNVSDATHIDLDAANPGGGASAIDGFYASALLARPCIVTVIANTGAYQVRSGLDYVGVNNRLQLDSAFAVGLDATSIVRIDAVVAVGGGSVIAQQVLNTIIEGPTQYDGNGEALPQGGTLADYNVTLAQGLREILAYCSHNATGLNGVNPIVKSRVGLRNRIVAQMNNGNRTVTSRDNT